ncbi:hypothetical protein FRC09_020425 [Ceratobasidium sp. 395]|nr:hypothetical protein FRC09_020425 [Ceratobasidium sp. 395]
MATTQKGHQCSQRPGAGSEYCWQHVGAATTNVRRVTETPVRETVQSDQCLAITLKGSQCSRRSKAGSGQGYCWQHIGRAAVEAPPVRNFVSSVNQCMATTLQGQQCKRSSKAGSGLNYCWQHVRQAEIGKRAVVRTRVSEGSETEQREDMTEQVDSTTELRVKNGSFLDTTELNQCMATTKAGHRCSRRPKAGSDHGYCWQHIGHAATTTVEKETDEPQPPLPARKSKPIKFEKVFLPLEWIVKDLTNETKAKLRSKMTEPPSKCEIPGYVYAFEIIDPETPDEIHIKVGYSQDVWRRLRQWKRQCPSKKIVFRGCWPCALQTESVDQETGRQVEAIGPGEPTPYPRRIEQLVHLELKDVAAYSLHIQPELRTKLTVSRSGTRGQCSDCGKMHREIFSFQRFPSSKLRGKEFDLVVLPVIKRWGMFVSKHV